MKTVILGNGLLGGELRWQTGWDTFNRDNDGIDITIPPTYENIIKDYDQVINCMGYTNTNHPCKEPSWSVNYIGVMDLVDMCNKYDKKLIQISTDYIYTNSVHGASEEDVPVHYSNWYTYSKILSDAYVQARGKKYLLVRTSFKPRPFPWRGGWVNLRGNFDYVNVIAGLIVRLMEKGANGVYNVGTEPKTMYELAIKTRPDCEKMYDNIIPGDTIMDLSKLKKTLDE